jgi:CIC family chloride channel protein
VSQTLKLSTRAEGPIWRWVRTSHWGLVAAAAGVGASAGLGAIAFRYLILWVTVAFTGHADYSAAGHAPNPWLPGLGIWFVVLAPAVGGLLYGPIVDRFAKEARGHGVPEVMLAIAERGGRIRTRVAAIKAFASAVCIGSGGSVGREGPIVQIGSAMGSALGQRLRLPEARLRLLVACGAAGGISATFNAPIAGVMFAMELILQDFEASAFGVVVIASVVANIIGRMAFGNGPFLALPEFELGSSWAYLLHAGLGVIAAVVGAGFIRALYGTEDLVDRLWRGPEWLRPAAGGLLLGLVLLALPATYGVGYPVMQRAIGGGFASWFLLLLLAGKIFATSLTIGIGGSGGVFAPSLFMGAMLGTAYGQLVHAAMPHVAGPAGAYGLVGMGALFAAASRAPATSVLIIFELTDDYRIIVPLLMAVAVSTAVSHFLSRDTIYTLKLRRLGVELARRGDGDSLSRISVREAMQPLADGLPVDLRVGEALDHFANAGLDVLPVVASDRTYRGVVSLRRLEEAVREDGVDRPLGDLSAELPFLTANARLDEALGTLLHGDVSGLPVLDGDRRTVIGWLTHRGVLRAYHRRRFAPLATSSP